MAFGPVTNFSLKSNFQGHLQARLSSILVSAKAAFEVRIEHTSAISTAFINICSPSGWKGPSFGKTVYLRMLVAFDRLSRKYPSFPSLMGHYDYIITSL